MGQLDIMTATRAESYFAFGLAEFVPGLNSSAEENDPWLSRDGLSLYFTTTAAAGRDIWRTTRTCLD